jgi:AraC-like DNA-binding protein
LTKRTVYQYRNFTVTTKNKVLSHFKTISLKSIMNKTNKDKIEKLIKLTMPIFNFLMTATVCTAGIIVYLQTSVNWIPWYIGIFALIHLSWGIASSLQDSSVDESFMPYYFVFMYAYLFPAALILWEGQVYSVIALYILLPLIIPSRHYASKHMISAGINSIFCVVALFVVSANVNIGIFYDIDERIVRILNIFIVTAALLGFTLFIYSYHKILKIMQDENNPVAKAEEKTETTETTENAQLKELYNKVIAYFDKKQPYKQAQYNLTMLASDLNTNTKYLSNAINMYSGGTFENLLNKYRLELVKKMLDEHLADKYTIEYIYTLAGYSSRSAFYKNFYKTFQTTPLEYQKMLKS